jgi:hypothetical protein
VNTFFRSRTGGWFAASPFATLLVLKVSPAFLDRRTPLVPAADRSGAVCGSHDTFLSIQVSGPWRDVLRCSRNCDLLKDVLIPDVCELKESSSILYFVSRCAEHKHVVSVVPG